MSSLGGIIDELSIFVGVLMVESLLYGIHVVLFSIAGYHLWPREASRKLIIFATLFMLFVLATADVALSYRLILHDIPAIAGGRLTLEHAIQRLLKKNLLQVTSNLLADGLLLYRFFAIWGQRYLYIVPPLLILVAETVWGYVSQVKVDPTRIHNPLTDVYLWCIFAYNIIMTILAAGRIWWVSRKTAAYTGHSAQKKRYDTAIAILVESGALYSISIFLLLVITIKDARHFFIVILPLRLVGIVPTLMVVQVELRRKNGQNHRDIAASTEVMSTVHTDSLA